MRELSLAAGALVISQSFIAVLFAAPIAGSGLSQYDLPGGRTAAGVAASFGTRGATIEMLQGGVVKDTKSDGSFMFNLPDEVNTTVRAKTDSAKLTVDLAFVGLPNPYSKSRLNPTPFPRVAGVPSLSVDVGSIDAANADDKTTARAFAVMDAMTTGVRFVESVLGEALPDRTKVAFPGVNNKYTSPGKTIYITEEAAPDWDILLHEFGHFAADEFGFLLPAGGDHFFGKETNASLAFNEGFATFFSLLAQQEDKTISPGIKFVGDAVYDNSTSPATFSVEIERYDARIGAAAKAKLKSKGIKDELSVARVMWDLADDTPEEPLDEYLTGSKTDNIALGAAKVWSLLKANGKDGTAKFLGRAAKDVLNANRGNFPAQILSVLDLGSLYTDHALAPEVSEVIAALGGSGASARSQPAVVVPPGLQFSWNTPLDPGNEGIDFQDDHDPEPLPPGADENNFAAFKLAFFDRDFSQFLLETGWIEATDPTLQKASSLDHTLWSWNLDSLSYSQLQSQLLLRGTDQFGWAILTDTQFGSRPMIFLGSELNADQPLWGDHGIASILTGSIPEPANLGLLAAACIAFGARRWGRPRSRRSRT